MERVFFCCLEKAYFCACGCHGRHTLNALLSIFVWSLTRLYLGKRPTLRHDESQFSRYDKAAGRLDSYLDDVFSYWAHLMEIRGDWMNYKTLFGFKGWASDCICWACGANKSGRPYWDFTSKALWRSCRLTTYQFLKLMAQNGIDRSVLFDAPGFILDFIMVDVLHCLDLGVSQEAIGNLFYYFIGLKFVPGNNQQERIQYLWTRISEYYKRARPPTRISNLTLEMVKRKGKSSRFRGKGAETRHLVPFCVELTEWILTQAPTTMNQSLADMFGQLFRFYNTMGTQPFPKDEASDAANNF